MPKKLLSAALSTISLGLIEASAAPAQPRSVSLTLPSTDKAKTAVGWTGVTEKFNVRTQDKYVTFEYHQSGPLKGYVSIRCLEVCSLDFRDRLDLEPKGVFALGEYPDKGNVHIASIWESGSRAVVIVYEVSPTSVRKVLSFASKGWPRFTWDAWGHEQVTAEDNLDESRPLRVWTWSGTKFKEKRAAAKRIGQASP